MSFESELIYTENVEHIRSIDIKLRRDDVKSNSKVKRTLLYQENRTVEILLRM